MNKPVHAFDPELTTWFSQRISNRAVSMVNLDDRRQLFYQLNQPGKNHDFMPCAYEVISLRLKEAEKIYSPLDIQDYCANGPASLLTPKLAPVQEQFMTDENLHECVNQTAAIILTQPSWLQHISQISTSHTVTSVQLMSIYLQLTRTEQEGSDLLDTYRSMLLASGIRIPALHSFSYCQQSGIIPEMLDFSEIQLILAHFPRILLPEILGFTVAYSQSSTLIEICFPKQQLPSRFFTLRHQQVKKQLDHLYDCITDYLALFPQQQQALWKRVQNGFWLYQLQMQRCRDQFNQILENPLSLQQKVARLFQQKAAAAIGHHAHINLQGKSLDHWFAELPANNQAFLQALQQSAYVNKQNPAESPFLKLFAFKGPMFGVLNETELTLIKSWLKAGITGISTTKRVEPNKKVFSRSMTLFFESDNSYAKLRNRELYYYLVNADLFPDVLPKAHKIVCKLLKASSVLSLLPFKHYSHEQFDTYIDTIYRHELNAYQPLQGKPKVSREAYVWGLEQMAPMILIDGCWLQNSQDLQKVYPEISEILFKIYCDETGNGHLEQNHPYIFQQLLSSLSIRVPPVDTAEFVNHPGFINSAFDLPVFMLSLSLYSVEFMPELLGLNMAIELSGLGKGYLTLVDEWTYWGIDPTIANIHISIDNAASGHTFLAKKAIQLYMDEVLKNSGDNSVVDMHWRRIYSGFASLRFVGRRFKLGLPILYLIQKYRSGKNKSVKDIE